MNKAYLSYTSKNGLKQFWQGDKNINPSISLHTVDLVTRRMPKLNTMEISIVILATTNILVHK